MRESATLFANSTSGGWYLNHTHGLAPVLNFGALKRYSEIGLEFLSTWKISANSYANCSCSLTPERPGICAGENLFVVIKYSWTGTKTIARRGDVTRDLRWNETCPFCACTVVINENSVDDLHEPLCALERVTGCAI
jgi:hypothetical protein